MTWKPIVGGIDGTPEFLVVPTKSRRARKHAAERAGVP